MTTWTPDKEELNVLRNELSIGQVLTKAMDNGKKYTIKISDHYIDMKKDDVYIGRLHLEDPSDVSTLKIVLENDTHENKLAFSVMTYLIEHYREHIKSNNLLGGLF